EITLRPFQTGWERQPKLDEMSANPIPLAERYASGHGEMSQDAHHGLPRVQKNRKDYRAAKVAVGSLLSSSNADIGPIFAISILWVSFFPSFQTGMAEHAVSR